MIEAVKKPWGSEYLSFSNDESAIWILSIKKGFSTSLHCHPNKTTGLLVLSGEVIVEFMNGNRVLRVGEKINIPPKRFHKTTALSDSVQLLEIESPVRKCDLVRLEDLNGRTTSAYESDTVSINNPFFIPRAEKQALGMVYGRLEFFHTYDLDFMSNAAPDLIIITAGGLCQSDTNDTIVSPGDIVDHRTIVRFLQAFNFREGTSLLCVRSIQ